MIPLVARIALAVSFVVLSFALFAVLKSRKGHVEMPDDIERKKKKFLDCLEVNARGERVIRLFENVKCWLDTNKIDDNGIADMKIEFPHGNGMGDGTFNAMYGVELALKCGTGVYTQEYRYPPKVIDGVVYVAQDNPLDIHWRVDIGAIKVEEKEDEKCSQ